MPLSFLSSPFLPYPQRMRFASRCLSVLSCLAVAAFADESDEQHYYNQFSVCDDSQVVIEDLSIMCDSPGAYYYGSGKYRNSASCQAGDKAKVLVELQILEDLEADGYLTVHVEGYGSVKSVVLSTDSSLCDSVVSSDGSTECPQAGYYTISERFYWGNQDDSYEYSFTPKVVVGVSSTENSNKYDLGGANTNKCNGDIFSDWTSGVRKSAANTLQTFVLTFGILCLSIGAILVAGWYIIRQAKKEQIIVDEELDESSYQNLASMVAKSKNLVDV